MHTDYRLNTVYFSAVRLSVYAWVSRKCMHAVRGMHRSGKVYSRRRGCPKIENVGLFRAVLFQGERPTSRVFLTLFPRARALDTGSPCLSPSRSFVNEITNKRKEITPYFFLFIFITRPFNLVLEKNNSYFNECLCGNIRFLLSSK